MTSTPTQQPTEVCGIVRQADGSGLGVPCILGGGVHTAGSCPGQVTPAELTTPELVHEYTAAKCRAVRGEISTDAQHARHTAVVDALRSRGVLD